MELVDAIIVTKADGDNKEKAIKTRNEYNQILRLLKAATEGWQTKAVACSSITGEGISDVWELILDFFNSTKKSGVFYARRKKQTTDWMLTSIRERLEQTFFQNEQIKKRLPVVQRNVETGRLPVSIAVENLLADFFNNQYKE